MTNDALAVAKFTVTRGEEVYHIKVEMVRSGSHDYGNKHGLIMSYREKGIETRYFDARYDKRFNTVESFDTFVDEFMKDQIDPEFTIKRIK